MLKIWIIVTIVLIPVGLSAASSDPLKKHKEPTVPANAAVVSGIVRNNRDQTVTGALIHFQKRGAAHESFQRRTSADGTFSVQLPPGIFHIVSQRRGEGRSSILVHLVQNQAMNLEISLQKGPRF